MREEGGLEKQDKPKLDKPGKKNEMGKKKSSWRGRGGRNRRDQEEKGRVAVVGVMESVRRKAE